MWGEYERVVALPLTFGLDSHQMTFDGARVLTLDTAPTHERINFINRVVSLELSDTPTVHGGQQLLDIGDAQLALGL